MMQERRYTGKDGCRTGGMQEKDGCRKRTDAGKEGYMTGRMQERRDEGIEG